MKFRVIKGDGIKNKEDIDLLRKLFDHLNELHNDQIKVGLDPRASMSRVLSALTIATASTAAEGGLGVEHVIYAIKDAYSFYKDNNS